MIKFQFAHLRKIADIQKWLSQLGEGTLDFCEHTGGISIFFWNTLRASVSGRFRWQHFIDQCYKIGVLSLPLVMLTSIFTGMVLALQSAYQLKLFAAEQFVSDLVSLSTTRELAPVLTAMMVAGRVGASMAAELGTMKVTEQIDALKSLATDPVHYLVVPRFFATISMVVLLTLYADVLGILGGYLVGVFKLGLSSFMYVHRTIAALVLKDMYTGLIKAFFFGIIVCTVSCYYGFRTSGGAEGVGQATTMAVVVSFISIITFDAFFTALFYFVF